MPIPDVLRRILRCWRCEQHPLIERDDSALTCPRCGAQFGMKSQVIVRLGAATDQPRWPVGGLEYDNNLRRWDRGYGARLDSLVIEHCRGAVLEIGCGTGRFLIAAAGRTWPLVGLDESMEMISRAAERGLPHLVQAPAERLPFIDRSFDTVVSVLAWGFVGNAAYAEVARVLRPGGQFVYHTAGRYLWSAFAAREKLRILRERLARRSCTLPGGRVVEHWYLSPAAERRMLRKVGMHLVQVTSAHYQAQRPSPVRSLFGRLAERWPTMASDVVVRAVRD